MILSWILWDERLGLLACDLEINRLDLLIQLEKALFTEIHFLWDCYHEGYFAYPDICKNPVTELYLSMGSRCRIWRVYFVQRWLFVGKDYSMSDMFKLNVEDEIVYAYIAEPFE